MYYYLEVGVVAHGGYPCLGETLALVVGEHIALARRTVDKHALHAVGAEHVVVGGDRLKVEVAFGGKGGEGGVDEARDLLEFLHFSAHGAMYMSIVFVVVVT